MPGPTTLLFDYGGTLDHDGAHWPVRWLACFRAAGAAVQDEPFLRAFREADRALPGRHDLSREGLAGTAALLGRDLAGALGLPEAAGARAAEAFVAESRAFLRRNRPLLERLRARYRLGLVSNFYGNLDAVLASEGLDGLFDAVADSARVGAEKPDPRIFRWALERLGADPRDALMVGDSPPADMRGAEGLGMPHALLGGQAPCCPGTPLLKTLLDLEPLLLAPSLPAAGVIAAGLGERLRSAGSVKPLVRVGGRPLVHWVVSGLLEAGARRVVLLFNSRGDEARAALEAAFPGRGLEFLRADTPTSFASFRLVATELARGHEAFLMSTVDALVEPAETARFAREALAPFPDGARPEAAVALTRFVEDEKPLWADAGADGRVTAFGDAALRRDAVTCGLYALTRGAAASLPAEAARLRDWWSSLPPAGRRVRGVLLADTVDVDRPADIAAAERLVAGFTGGRGR